MTIDEQKYLGNCRKVPIEKATTATGGLTMIHAESWWLVVDECVLYFKSSSPQCNHSEKIAKSLRDRLCPSATVRHIPLVFEPTTPENWR